MFTHLIVIRWCTSKRVILMTSFLLHISLPSELSTLLFQLICKVSLPHNSQRGRLRCLLGYTNFYRDKGAGFFILSFSHIPARSYTWQRPLGFCLSVYIFVCLTFELTLMLPGSGGSTLAFQDSPQLGYLPEYTLGIYFSTTTWFFPWSSFQGNFTYF